MCQCPLGAAGRQDGWAAWQHLTRQSVTVPAPALWVCRSAARWSSGTCWPATRGSSSSWLVGRAPAVAARYGGPSLCRRHPLEKGPPPSASSHRRAAARAAQAHASALRAHSGAYAAHGYAAAGPAARLLFLELWQESSNSAASAVAQLQAADSQAVLFIHQAELLGRVDGGADQAAVSQFLAAWLEGAAGAPVSAQPAACVAGPGLASASI